MSLQSHYSIKKASAALGFGTENLILLNTDERSVPPLFTLPTDASLSAAFLFSRGRVIPADLEAKVIEAKQKVRSGRRDSAHLSEATHEDEESSAFLCVCRGLFPCT